MGILYFYSHKSIGWYKVISGKASAKPVGALGTRLAIDMLCFHCVVSTF